MDVHKNARLTPRGRELMVKRVLEGETPKHVARSLCVCERTVRRWLARYQSEDCLGLADRSSRPHRSPRAIAGASAQRIVTLRRRRWTMAWIASELAVSRATVSRVLKKEGLHRLSSLDPAPLPKRYERDHPGELLHLNVKKLARIVKIGHRMTGDRRDCTEGAGWEFAFVAVDDHSRLGFVRLFSDEKKRTAAAFLEQAAQYYRHLNLPIKRILTDNGPAFHSLTFADTCRRLRIRHSFTRPYRPQTNGKAERFIQSALREWAYGRPYRHSCERIHHLADWLHHYNWHRPHSSLSGKPPISRLGLAEDNVLRLHS